MEATEPQAPYLCALYRISLDVRDSFFGNEMLRRHGIALSSDSGINNGEMRVVSPIGTIAYKQHFGFFEDMGKRIALAARLGASAAIEDARWEGSSRPSQREQLEEKLRNAEGRQTEPAERVAIAKLRAIYADVSSSRNIRATYFGLFL